VSTSAGHRDVELHDLDALRTRRQHAARPGVAASARNSGNTSDEKSTGVPRVPRYDGAAMALPPRLLRREQRRDHRARRERLIAERHERGGRPGLEGGGADSDGGALPVLRPRFTAKRTARSASAARTAASSWPVTTTQSPTEREHASTLQRTTGLPLSSKEELLTAHAPAKPAAENDGGDQGSLRTLTGRGAASDPTFACVSGAGFTRAGGRPIGFLPSAFSTGTRLVR